MQRAEILVRPGDTRWYLYVAMSRARQSTVAHVIIDRLDHEPLYQPGRTARHILEAVLANDEPVSLTDRQRHAQAAVANPARLYDRYQHAQTEELRHRLTHTLHHLGAGQLLQDKDAWQLTATALAVEQAGLDAGAILTATPTGSPPPSRRSASNSTTPATTSATPTARPAPPAPTPAWSPNPDPTSTPTSPATSTPSASNSTSGDTSSPTSSPPADGHPNGPPPSDHPRTSPISGEPGPSMSPK